MSIPHMYKTVVGLEVVSLVVQWPHCARMELDGAMSFSVDSYPLSHSLLAPFQLYRYAYRSNIHSTYMQDCCWARSGIFGRTVATLRSDGI